MSYHQINVDQISYKKVYMPYGDDTFVVSNQNENHVPATTYKTQEVQVIEGW